MRDIAFAEPDGLVDIDDVLIAKAVLSGIACRLSQDELLERIAHSRFPIELLQFLPHVYGSSSKSLQPVAKLLVEGGSDHFDDDALRGFADAYWSSVVRERIILKDFQRAWDEIRSAFRGIRTAGSAPTADPHDPPEHGAPQNLAASLDCVHRLVHELHGAMCRAGLLEEVLMAHRPHARFGPRQTPGILFAVAVKGFCKERKVQFSLPGLEAVAIATRLNAERNKAREKRRSQQLERAAY